MEHAWSADPEQNERLQRAVHGQLSHQGDLVDERQRVAAYVTVLCSVSLVDAGVFVAWAHQAICQATDRNRVWLEDPAYTRLCHRYCDRADLVYRDACQRGHLTNDTIASMLQREVDTGVREPLDDDIIGRQVTLAPPKDLRDFRRGRLNQDTTEAPNDQA